jgi:hypothetical protein
LTGALREEAAELYYHTPGAGSRKAVSYRRFETLAEAVSFVMNEVFSRDRMSCFIEFDERRIGYEEISKLYREEEGSDQQQPGEST